MCGLLAVPFPRSGGRSSGFEQGGAQFAGFPSVCGASSQELWDFLPQSKDVSRWTRVLVQTDSENAECFSVEMTPLPARRQRRWRFKANFASDLQSKDLYPVDFIDCSLVIIIVAV